MAQKRQRRRRKNWTLRIMVLLLLAIAAVICYLVWDAYFKPKETLEKTSSHTETTEIVVPQAMPSHEQVEDASETPEEVGSDVVEQQEDPGLNDVVQYEGEDPNESEELTGAITYVGVNGSKLAVRVNLDQYLDSGECVLILQRDGVKIYEERAEVMSVASTATCKGFDVSLDGLGHGVTEVLINVDSGAKSGAMRGEVSL